MDELVVRMRISKRSAGTFLVLVGIFLLISFQVMHTQVLRFLEIYISPDGEITPGGERQLDFVVNIFAVMVMVLGYGLIKSEDQSWRNRMRQIFLTDPLCSTEKTLLTPKFMLISSTVIGLFLILHIRLYDPDSQIFRLLYLEDGIFESLTPLLMLISIGLVGVSIPKLRRDTEFASYRNLVTVIYVFLMIIFFLNAMEEISWGQRIFNWETPQSFEGNIQNETNLHNYFNQYYLLFYRSLVVFPLIIILSIWLEISRRYLVINRLVLPHPSLLGLGMLIAIVSLVWYKEQELLEEMFAVFFLFYSLRIYNCFRLRGKIKPE